MKIVDFNLTDSDWYNLNCEHIQNWIDNTISAAKLEGYKFERIEVVPPSGYTTHKSEYLTSGATIQVPDSGFFEGKVLLFFKKTALLETVNP